MNQKYKWHINILKDNQSLTNKVHGNQDYSKYYFLLIILEKKSQIDNTLCHERKHLLSHITGESTNRCHFLTE